MIDDEPVQGWLSVGRVPCTVGRSTGCRQQRVTGPDPPSLQDLALIQRASSTFIMPASPWDAIGARRFPFRNGCSSSGRSLGSHPSSGLGPGADSGVASDLTTSDRRVYEQRGRITAATRPMKVDNRLGRQ